MATQLAEAADELDTGTEGGNDQGGERNFEEEARSHGWVPKDEFKGDPTRWTDAESFVKKADEVMPLLRKKTQAQDREIADLKKQIKRASEHFTKAEERAYERALSDLRKEQEAAVKAGDLAAHREVSKKIDDLRNEVAETKPKVDASPLEVKKALVDFRDANPWYDGETAADKRARDYADILAEEYADKANELPPAEFFGFIADKVKERYPTLGKGEAETRRRSAVEGAGGIGRPSRGGKSFNDLPVEAQRTADKWIKSGLIKSREEYVKTYPWDAKD